jgi:hypothetical protein
MTGPLYLARSTDGLPSGGQQLVARRELTATLVMPANAGRAVEVVAEWQRTGRQPPEQARQIPESYPPLNELALTPPER